MNTTQSEERTFTIGEAVRFFEGKSITWLRWRERTVVFVHQDGTPIEVPRKPTRSGSGPGYRHYTLSLITQINEALWRQGKTTEQEYKWTKQRIAESSNEESKSVA